jgi:hypothetical protein
MVRVIATHSGGPLAIAARGDTLRLMTKWLALRRDPPATPTNIVLAFTFGATANAAQLQAE